MKIQNKIQSMHWHNVQISIYVHLTYILYFAIILNGSNTPNVIRELHYYISNDTCHDTLLVQHCFMLHWQFLKDQGCSPTKHIVWNDGCFGQFKSSRAWYFVSCYSSLITSEFLPIGCHMIWSFFATGHGHGKGEVDGFGALMKIELRKDQIKPHGQKLQNVNECVQFLKSKCNKYHVAYPSTRKHVNKFFWEVKVGDVDKSKGWECGTLNGSQKMHQVKSISHKDPTLLFTSVLFI